MKQYFVAPIVALGLAACSGGGSNSTVGEVDDNSTPQLLTADMSVRMEQEIGQIGVGQFNVAGSTSSNASQLGGLLFISGSTNHILIDIPLGEARFYESRNDYPEIADYSGTGTMANSSPVLDGETFSISFESEAAQTAVIEDDTDDRVFPETHSISLLSGTYTQQFGPSVLDNVNISITIDSDGLITGSTDSGCVFNGTVTHPISTRNAYYFETDVSNCDESGGYLGAGYIEDVSDTNYLNLHLFSNNIAMNYSMRQN